MRYGKYDGDGLLENVSVDSDFTSPPQELRTNYTHDNRNALQRVTIQGPAGTTFDTSYSYDGLGNLRNISDAVAATSLDLRPDTHDFDRLCVVVASGAGDRPCTYRYDGRGSVRRVLGTEATCNYGIDGQLISGQAAGHLSSIEYDPFGSLASLRSSGGGIVRQESVYGGTTRIAFTDLSGNPISVGTGNNAVQSFAEREIVSPQGTIAVVRHANTDARAILYPVGESQGTGLLLDATGKETETIDYKPYGSVASDSGSADSLISWPYQWNGGHLFDGLGLVALGERVLDGDTGRFLQRDPTINESTARSAHPNMFAWDNPVGFTDPTGGEPSGEKGGMVSGLAAFGKMIYRAAEERGSKVDPYVETRWYCSADRDCISAVESAYPLTDFEKQIRESSRAGGEWRYYSIVMDRLSGAVLGYQLFNSNISTYDRGGKLLSTMRNSNLMRYTEEALAQT